MNELTYILSGLGLFLLGFGLSQLSFVVRLSGQIKVNVTEIENIKKDFAADQKAINQRFSDMVDLVEKMVEHDDKIIQQNTVVIAELRARR